MLSREGNMGTVDDYTKFPDNTQGDRISWSDSHATILQTGTGMLYSIMLPNAEYYTFAKYQNTIDIHRKTHILRRII